MTDNIVDFNVGQNICAMTVLSPEFGTKSVTLPQVNPLLHKFNVCHPEMFKHLRSHNAFCQFYVKVLYIFVEGPDDDSNGIETCRPSPINNIIMIVVFD